jgi:hypothetical protein
MTKKDLERLAKRTPEKLDARNGEKATYVVVKIFDDTSFLRNRPEKEATKDPR